MKKIILIMTFIILLWPSNSLGQGVCFDDTVAGQMVVALEQAKITEQQLTIQAQGNVELQGQIDIFRGTIKLYEEQIIIYKNMVDMNAKIGEAKDKACQEQIKAASPTFMQNIGKYFTGVGIGAILMGITFIVL
jgi:hypothetical protein